jgi:hypothetical protein
MKMDPLERKQFWLGIYLIVVSVILTFFIVSFWPTDYDVTFFGKGCTIDPEVRLILLVILVGALGSCVHAATSFSTFVGNRSLGGSWMWWYLLRPLIGMTLALIFYFAIRGGLLLLSSATNSEDISPFGIAAISGLTGMFSKQAADKLRDLFDSLFKTEKGKGDEERVDKLEQIRPVTSVMLRMNKITGLRMEEGKTEKDVTIKELYNLLKGVVTRIPILDDTGAVKYIIHQSMLYKFISERSVESGKERIDIAAETLDDFIKYPGMFDQVGKSITFVSTKATLGDAKAQMEKTKNCQDVFVTENGRPDEPIIGWLPNTEISKHART